LQRLLQENVESSIGVASSSVHPFPLVSKSTTTRFLEKFQSAFSDIRCDRLEHPDLQIQG
jgi:hypothetical protein